MPVIPEESKRTSSVRVRLSPELLERLETLAKRYGMPLSTLGAFAIARFVQSEEMSRMVVMDTARRQAKTFEEKITDERMERLFGPMFENMLTAFQRAQIDEERGGDETKETER